MHIAQKVAMQKSLGLKVGGIGGPQTDKVINEMKLASGKNSNSSFDFANFTQKQNNSKGISFDKLEISTNKKEPVPLSLYSEKSEPLSQNELEIAAMKLSPDESARFLWKAEYNIRYLKEMLRTADMTLDIRRMGENMVNKVEQVVDINPQFVQEMILLMKDCWFNPDGFDIPECLAHSGIFTLRIMHPLRY